ncbi:MAG: CusA/CzcA family heavy metal efflux RND transporter [Bacteroidota bacterium]|nr:CusA/CzcA family heavy metal efflux RND transporter [Bacteroidota bacterium]
MIERIVEWSAGHRIFIIAAFAIIAVVGAWAISTTPLDAIPDLSENQVIVFTEYMGRSPQIVEDQVTFPLVKSLQGLPSVKAVRAQSMFGMSFIYIIFDDATDIYWARSRVLEKLSTVQASLPQGSKTQLGPDGTGIGQVYWYTVEGKGFDLGTLRTIQDWFIKPQLQSVEGVAEIASAGGYVKQYQINVDPIRMRSYGFDIGQIQNAVMRVNNDVGGKILESGGQEQIIRGQGYLKSVDDIRQITLEARGGIPITIGDVADVTIGSDIRRGALDKNGEGEVTGGIVVMRMGENAKAVIDRIKEKIAAIEPGLPNGVKILPAYDRSELIEASIDNLYHTLIEEAIIVTLVILLFLFHLPSALRIIIEIPISVLIAFILMRIFGISSNIMSLGGIAIGIGVLVDASIVLLENAHRHLAEAQELKEKNGTEFDYRRVIITSTKQVARPIFFSILIIVISFLPVFLLTGQEGKLFHPLAFTKTFSLLGSAIVSITLVPVLMTLLMKGRFQKEEKNPVSRFFINLYRPVIQWALKHRMIALGLNLLALVVAIPLAMGLGSEFMPALDEGSLLFMPTMLPSVSLSEAKRIMQVQDAIIKDYPEVLQVLGKVGRAETPTDPAPVSMLETIVLLKPHDQWRPDMTKDKIINDLTEKLQIPGVANSWTQPIINRINMLTTGVRTDIGVKFFGENLDTLERLATDAEAILKKVPGSADVVAERVQGGVFLDVKINQQAAAKYGVSQSVINDVVEGAIGGNTIGTVIEGRERFPINVRFMSDYRTSIEDLRKIPVPVGSSSSEAITFPGSVSSAAMAGSQPAGSQAASSSMGSGDQSVGMTPAPMATSSQPKIRSFSGGARSLFDSPNATSRFYIPLGELADISLASGPPMISSENALLRSLVYLNVRGRDMGSFVNEAQKALKTGLRLPAGYTLNWSGQFENQQHAKQRLMFMVPLVFLIIFCLLYFTLKDFKEASVVMLSVPFALIGGVFLIAILGYNWSVAVWVGFIALYGVAVETGVVMVVYLHEALDKRLHEANTGKRPPLTDDDIYHATVDGAVLRLRPKLMTVATAMLGLVPILWSTGVGSDVMRPIAAPMIGGLLTSAVHVLIVTPVIFFIMKRRQLRKGTLTESAISGWMRHAP